MTGAHSKAGDFKYFRGEGLELVVCRRSAVSYPLHNHISVFTLGLVLDGTLELTADSRTRICGRDSVFAIPPYTPHRIDARTRYTLFSLCVHKDMAAAGSLESRAAAISAFLRRAVGQADLEARLMRALKELPALNPTPSLRRRTAMDSLRAQLELEPEHRYNLDDMAALMFTSKYSLIRTFKAEVGLTPHQFQIQNRIRRGQRLLESSAAAAEAALAAGFCDQSHFTRQFKRVVGLTPAEYARSCRVLPPPIRQAPE